MATFGRLPGLRFLGGTGGSAPGDWAGTSKASIFGTGLGPKIKLRAVQNSILEISCLSLCGQLGFLKLPLLHNSCFRLRRS